MEHGERFNSLSHLVGAGLALAGGTALVVLAARIGDPWKIVSFSIYAVVLLALFVFSTLYHGARGRAKAVLRKFDHCGIYLLIAGTYTPFSLVSLRGAWGWSLLGVIWGLAIAGVVQELWLARGARLWSMAIYLVMGWLVLVAIWPLWQVLKPAGFALLLAGGVLYTAGIVFYARDDKIRHGHGIWHLFVMGGSICHFLTVLFHVA